MLRTLYQNQELYHFLCLIRPVSFLLLWKVLIGLVVHGFFNLLSYFFILHKCSLLPSALDVFAILLAIWPDVTVDFVRHVN